MAQKSTARMVAVSRKLLRLNRPRPPFLFRPPDCCLFWRRAREHLRPASWLFLVVPEHCLAACSLTRHSCSIHTRSSQVIFILVPILTCRCDWRNPHQQLNCCVARTETLKTEHFPYPQHLGHIKYQFSNAKVSIRIRIHTDCSWERGLAGVECSCRAATYLSR